MANWAAEKALTRLREIIARGYGVVETESFDGDSEHVLIDIDAFAGWKAQSLVFLHDYLGDHPYTKSVEDALMWSGRGVRSAIKILEALDQDIEAGYLATFQELVHADIFGDFLEMAEYLLSEGFKDPAAVLVGGVLEQHLRQLCSKHLVPVEIDTGNGPRPKKADQMNSDLAKQKNYSVLEQKQVTAWLDLRNKAAHGKYAEYSADHVSLMLQGVRSFVARYPA
jgi:hypothetical protein